MLLACPIETEDRAIADSIGNVHYYVEHGEILKLHIPVLNRKTMIDMFAQLNHNRHLSQICHDSGQQTLVLLIAIVRFRATAMRPIVSYKSGMAPNKMAHEICFVNGVMRASHCVAQLPAADPLRGPDIECPSGAASNRR